jgi:hypothetical protein
MPLDEIALVFQELMKPSDTFSMHTNYLLSQEPDQVPH